MLITHHLKRLKPFPLIIHHEVLQVLDLLQPIPYDLLIVPVYSVQQFPKRFDEPLFLNRFVKLIDDQL